MIIEGNETQLAAMAAGRRGDKAEGMRLQEAFLTAFREEYAEKDHCSCTEACHYHGNCKECVVIHRAQQDHVPACMRSIINAKLKLLSEVTQHTVVSDIQALQPE